MQWAWLGRINSETTVIGAWEVHELAWCLEIHHFTSDGLKIHLDQDPASASKALERGHLERTSALDFRV